LYRQSQRGEIEMGLAAVARYLSRALHAFALCGGEGGGDDAGRSFAGTQRTTSVLMDCLYEHLTRSSHVLLCRDHGLPPLLLRGGRESREHLIHHNKQECVWV